MLFPRATVITPNLDEVRLLVGIDVHDRDAQYEAAKVLHALGPRHVLVKGGHLSEDVDTCVDLHYDGDTPHNDLLVSLLQSFGLPDETFGEPEWCDGPLRGLA